MSTKLSIIILSYNTRELLRQCLESSVVSLQSSAISSEIIVVDNGSTDGSIKLINEFRKLTNSREKSVNSLMRNPPIIKLIQNKENLGYAKGNNEGIKVAGGQYLMILNSDTIVKTGAIKKLVDFLDKNEEVNIVGPKLLNDDGTPQANCGRFPDLLVSAVMLFKEHFGGSGLVRFSPDRSRVVDWLMGAAFVTKREVIEKIGGFDEKIFMYMEDVEWFYRAKKAGFKAYFFKDAEIIHLGRGSSKSGKKEPILNIYKGLIYFFGKHRSLLELVILKIMLKLKAGIALTIGLLTNNQYLKETYGEAFKMV